MSQAPGSTPPSLRVAMNGITGRMGYRQHLLRSILPIRAAGGVSLVDSTRLQVEPILAMTSLRAVTLTRAMNAGKHIFTEKPTAETLGEAVHLARRARDQGVTPGVVHDKLYLPGLVKLRRLVTEGFFGRILSLRGEFGYWVFEGDTQPAQRPSWNYRAEDGGGMTTDMFCHWNYVLEGIAGPVRSVAARAVTHIPTRWDERGKPYTVIAYAAAHVVPLPLADSTPGVPAVLDWDATRELVIRTALLLDPHLAAQRMRSLLAPAGCAV